MRIAIINNYVKDWDEKIGILRKVISSIVSELPIFINFQDVNRVKLLEYDALILSGSQSSLSRRGTIDKYINLISLIRDFNGPILGICFGHQLLGIAFGSRVLRLNKKFYGFYGIQLLEEDNLFKGLPKNIIVFEAHSEIVRRVMPEFIHLAKSTFYEVEAVKHNLKPIYGVQFHPERYDSSNYHGRIILKNFFDIVKVGL